MGPIWVPYCPCCGERCIWTLGEREYGWYECPSCGWREGGEDE
jgi:hypothetical protein